MAAKQRIIPSLTSKDISRFWAKVDVGKPDQCWPWLACTDRQGYGWFHLRSRQFRAARVAYILGNGPIPDSQIVMHTCDSPGCCNFTHLLAGTWRDNMQDMISKGRARHVRVCGERNGRAKLTAAQVLGIREEAAAGHLNETRTAERYGVAPCTISNIVRGRIWRDVGGPIAEGDLLRRGERVHTAKLTAADVRQIRAEHAGGAVGFAHLGRRYGVTRECIYRIVRRLSWAHIA